MKKEILLEVPFMNANPYLAIFFSFVEVNQVTVSWLSKFFTSMSAYVKGQNDGFDVIEHSIVSKLYLNDDFLMTCPFVEICNINMELLSNNIIEVIENAIEKGYSVATVINPRFL